VKRGKRVRAELAESAEDAKAGCHAKSAKMRQGKDQFIIPLFFILASLGGLGVTTMLSLRALSVLGAHPSSLLEVRAEFAESAEDAKDREVTPRAPRGAKEKTNSSCLSSSWRPFAALA